VTILVALNRVGWFGRVLPGVALCLAVAVVADHLRRAEIGLAGRPFIDPVVLAILLGASIRCVWRPGLAWERGITYSAKTLLELAVVLLGASIDAAAMSIPFRRCWPPPCRLASSAARSAP
jgi:uncharacterized membrane protein YadS